MSMQRVAQEYTHRADERCSHGSQRRPQGIVPTLEGWSWGCVGARPNFHIHASAFNKSRRADETVHLDSDIRRKCGVRALPCPGRPERGLWGSFGRTEAILATNAAGGDAPGRLYTGAAPVQICMPTMVLSILMAPCLSITSRPSLMGESTHLGQPSRHVQLVISGDDCFRAPNSDISTLAAGLETGFSTLVIVEVVYALRD